MLEVYGRKHFKAIGAKGFAATVARHWGGDRLAFREYLSRKGWEAVIDAMTDLMLSRQLEAVGRNRLGGDSLVMADFDDPDLGYLSDESTAIVASQADATLR